MSEKTYEVLWTKSAQLDLLEIIDYIKSDSEMNAYKIFERIKKKASELNLMPFKGRIVTEFRKYNINKYREIIISPWRIIYLIENHLVYVLNVIDSRRDIEELLFKKIMQYSDDQSFI